MDKGSDVMGSSRITGWAKTSNVAVVVCFAAIFRACLMQNDLEPWTQVGCTLCQGNKKK